MLQQMEGNYDNCCWQRRPEKFWEFRVFLLVQVARIPCEWLFHSAWRVLQEVFFFAASLLSASKALTNFMLEKVKKLHFSERAGSSMHLCAIYWHPHASSLVNNIAPTRKTTYHNYFWNGVSAVSFVKRYLGCVCNCWPSTTSSLSFVFDLHLLYVVYFWLKQLIRFWGCVRVYTDAG